MPSFWLLSILLMSLQPLPAGELAPALSAALLMHDSLFSGMAPENSQLRSSIWLPGLLTRLSWLTAQRLCNSA